MFVFGCDEQVSNVHVESTNSIQADDFALNAVGGLIKGGLSDANALEREINKPGDNPYTRVDIDNDGKRDIILVDEVEHGAKFEFIAHPGNGVPDQSIAVASFTMESGQIHYHANYTSYVHGYDNPDYRYYDTFAHDLLWVAWLTSPSRSVYLGVPTHYSFYHTQPRTVFHTTQTTVFHTTNVHITPPAPRSMTFNSSSYSSKVTPPHYYNNTSRTTSLANHPAATSSRPSFSSYSSSSPRSSFSTSSRTSFSSKPSTSSFSRRPRPGKSERDNRTQDTA
jgi:hypothetical protein